MFATGASFRGGGWRNLWIPQEFIWQRANYKRRQNKHHYSVGYGLLIINSFHANRTFETVTAARTIRYIDWDPNDLLKWRHWFLTMKGMLFRWTWEKLTYRQIVHILLVGVKLYSPSHSAAKRDPRERFIAFLASSFTNCFRRPRPAVISGILF